MPQRTTGTSPFRTDISRLRAGARSHTRVPAVPQPTPETESAMRTVLEEHWATLEAEAENAKRRREEEAENERRLREEEAEKARRREEDAAAAAEGKPTPTEMESMLHELLDQLEAAEARATEAEQHAQAIYASQQAAQAAQHLTAAGDHPQQPPAVVVQEAPVVQEPRSSFATWAGWSVAVLAVTVVAGAYLTRYRPLQDQLAAKTTLLELQARESREAEASLRRGFDQERETLQAELSAARAAAAAATAAAAPATEDATNADDAASDGDDAADTKEAKLAARAAKREAWLAKKAEWAAKREARAAARKARGGSSDKDDDDKASSKSESKSKPAARDTSDDLIGDDPLEGL